MIGENGVAVTKSRGLNILDLRNIEAVRKEGAGHEKRLSSHSNIAGSLGAHADSLDILSRHMTDSLGPKRLKETFSLALSIEESWDVQQRMT